MKVFAYDPVTMSRKAFLVDVGRLKCGRSTDPPTLFHDGMVEFERIS